MSRIIVVEGADKHGKATQAKMLLDFLRNQEANPYLQVNATLVEVPVPGMSHRLIYWMLRNDLAKRLPNVFQFMQFLNKLFFQWFMLPKLQRSYDFIILDRWALSGLVYGEATGVNPWFNRALFSLLQKPDITLIMNGQSFRRSNTVDDSYEKDTELQTAVQDRYLQIGLSNEIEGHQLFGTYELINNLGTVEEVHAQVIGVLQSTHLLPQLWSFGC